MAISGTQHYLWAHKPRPPAVKIFCFSQAANQKVGLKVEANWSAAKRPRMRWIVLNSKSCKMKTSEKKISSRKWAFKSLSLHFSRVQCIKLVIMREMWLQKFRFLLATVKDEAGLHCSLCWIVIFLSACLEAVALMRSQQNLHPAIQTLLPPDAIYSTHIIS